MKRRRRSRAGLRRYWLLFIPLLLAGSVGAYYGAKWPGFHPRKVVIVGNRTVPATEIAQRAAIRTNVNLWLQNAQAAANRVAAIPNIDHVSIHRALPAQVKIEVTERVPFAVVPAHGDMLVIDKELRVLSVDKTKRLPVFYASLREGTPKPGTFLKDADLRILGRSYVALREGGVIVSSLQLDGYGDLIGVMRNGVRLLLGSQENLAEKVALVRPILAQTANGSRRIAAVDLRAPRTPVVVYR